jgi:hypothetical protein
MPLKVYNPTPGVVKVVNNYPQATVKVTQNYGTQQGAPVQQTANPQPQAGSTAVQTTYRPQTTATQQQINAARVSQQWAEQQAAALRAEQERIAYEKLVRKNTFNSTTAAKQNDWKSKVAGAVGLGSTLAQWRSRNQSAKMAQDLNMSASEIEAAVRHFEREATKKIAAFNANPTQEAYDSYIAWVTTQEKFFGDTIQNFNVANATTNANANKPFTGRAATVGRYLTAAGNTIGAPAKKMWDIGMWGISQTERAVNTAKNFVNPNNLRQYYDGTEIKGGSRDLRWAYNASKDQRIVSRSKADEQAQLSRLPKNTGGTNIFGTSTSTGFLRGGMVDKLRIKYGDDLVNLALDPANWIGAGLAAKLATGAKSTKIAGNIGKVVSGAKNWIGKYNKDVPGLSRLPALNKNYVSPSEKMFKLGEQNKLNRELSQQKASWLMDQLGKAKDKNTQFFRDLSVRGKYKNAADELGADLAARAEGLGKQLDPTAVLSWTTRLADKPAWYTSMLQRGVRNGGRITKRDIVRLRSTLPLRDTAFLYKSEKKVRATGAHKIAAAQKQLEKDIQFAVSLGDNQYVADSISSTRFKGRYIPASFTGNTKQSRYDFKRFRKNTQHTYTPRTLAQNMYDRAVNSKYTEKLFGDYRKAEKSLIKDTQVHTDVTRLKQHYTDELGKNIGVNPAGKSGKKYFNQLFGKVGENRGVMRGVIRDLKLQQADKIARDANVEKYKAILQTQKRVKRITGLPNNVWKAAVTVATPAWYVNNAVTNEITGVAAGGLGFLAEQAKHFNPFGKMSRKVANETLPKGVGSNIAEGLGLHSVARMGSAIENAGRIPLFKAMKKQGLTDDEALKVVNNHLFDYKTKNWDRPVKAVLPFWLWSKSLAKLGLTMPLHNPRGASGFNHLNRKLEQDFNAAPSDQTSYIDQSTGQEVQVDRKDKLKGKLKIGDKKWLDTGWLPFTPDRAAQFGINPYIAASGELLSGENKFGDVTTLSKTLTDRTTATRWLASIGAMPGVKKWFSESGYGKMKQGSDPSQSNYDKYLDPNIQQGKNAKAFFGIPGVTTYDPAVNTFRNSMTSFNKEFFAVDWDKAKSEDYNKAMADQKAMAAKYGLTWDQVNQDWSKFDTLTTQNTKKLKDAAYTDQSKFWSDWFPLKGQTNKRNEVVRKYYTEQTAKANPYAKFPVFRGDDGLAKTKDDKLLSPATIKDTTAVNVGGKWFKSQASADKYWAGQAKRKNVVQLGGKFFKNQANADAYAAGQAKKDFWTKYYATNDKKLRAQMLVDNPQFNTNKFTTPTDQAGWDSLKRTIKLNKQNKLRLNVNGFAQREMDMKKLTVPPVRFKKTKKIAFKF